MALALRRERLGRPIVVASLPGHGTTSLSHAFQLEGFDATHEEIYGTRGYRDGTRRDQDIEVSGFAIPYQVDDLLVRDPRGAIPNLVIRQRPDFQQFTIKHLGLQPHSIKQCMDAWVAWFRWALDQEPENIYRAEDLDIQANRTWPKRAALSWHDLSKPVRDLAEEFGYTPSGAVKGGPKNLARIGGTP